jgi:hypothetical protein
MVDLPVLQDGKAVTDHVERLGGCVEKRASTLPDDSVACRPRSKSQRDLVEKQVPYEGGRIGSGAICGPLYRRAIG